MAIDGTGVIVTANAAQLTIITNSLGMMGHLLKTYTQKSQQYPSLADDERFQALIRSSLARANLLVYANPATVAPILRDRARQQAANAASGGIDAKAERARIDAKILREAYDGRAEEALSPEEKAEFDQKGEDEMKALRKRVKEQQIPALMAEQERWISWSEAVTGALLMLALDPKSFDLSVRVVAPLEAKQP
jgi:hypothetical protein